MNIGTAENLGMEENNTNSMPHIAPSDFHEFMHKRRFLSYQPFINKKLLLDYSMNKFIMNFDSWRNYGWSDEHEDFSSFFNEDEDIYIVPNAIDHSMLKSMMPQRLTEDEVNQYIGFLETNNGRNEDYKHFPEVKLIPSKINEVMDLSPGTDEANHFIRDIAIVTEDKIRVTLYKDIILKRQSLLEYFSDQLSEMVQERVSKRYRNLSRIVLNGRDIPNQSGIHSIVKNYVTPRSRGRGRSRGRQGSYVGGKTMKKNKIKNKRTKRNKKRRI